MSGDTIVALFDSIPPTDTSSKPRIRQIVALGDARSFYQMKNSKGPADEPTVNYARGRVIEIDFEERKVATVTVTDQATGVMVEPAAQPAPAKPDNPATSPRAATPTPPNTKTATPVKPPPGTKK
jgi:hypothetical protein